MSVYRKLLKIVGFSLVVAMVIFILDSLVIGHAPQALADGAPPTLSGNENRGGGGGGGGGGNGGGHGRSSPAQRIRSYSGESWATPGPNFNFPVDHEIKGFVITDLVFSFPEVEQNFVHQVVVAVDGKQVFSSMRTFRNEGVEPVVVHLQSGIPVSANSTVFVYYMSGNPDLPLSTTISGYNF